MWKPKQLRSSRLRCVCLIPPCQLHLHMCGHVQIVALWSLHSIKKVSMRHVLICILHLDCRWPLCSDYDTPMLFSLWELLQILPTYPLSLNSAQGDILAMYGSHMFFTTTGMACSKASWNPDWLQWVKVLQLQQLGGSIIQNICMVSNFAFINWNNYVPCDWCAEGVCIGCCIGQIGS